MKRFETVLLFLDGILKDLKLVQGFMSDQKILVFDFTLANCHVRQNKSDMVETFKKSFYQKDTRLYVIYYTVAMVAMRILSTNKELVF